jgi:hypothetical protein
MIFKTRKCDFCKQEKPIVDFVESIKFSSFGGKTLFKCNSCCGNKSRSERLIQNSKKTKKKSISDSLDLLIQKLQNENY